MLPTLSEALVNILVESGWARVYGIIGTSLLDLVDSFYNNRDRIAWITTRHEQVAVSAADAEGRTSGVPGIASVHAGPGLLNAAISVGIAARDRAPLMVIVGGVRRRLRGTDAWLEVPLKEVFQPITASYRVLDNPNRLTEEIASLIRGSLRPPRGPVILEVPEDMWKASTNISSSGLARIREALAYEPPEGDVNNAVETVLDILSDSTRPLILACGELTSDPRFDQEKLLLLAEKMGAYIVTSGNGRGACPEDHPRCLGRVGFGGGGLAADNAFREADFVLVLGNELDDITTYAYTLLPHGDIVVISQDPSARKRPILYDHFEARPVSVLLRLLNTIGETRENREWDHIISTLRESWSQVIRETSRKPADGEISAGYFFRLLDMALPRDRIITAGQGTHILYTYNYMRVYKPRSFLAATNLGAMSYALPAGIGAKLSNPERKVVTVAGDGDFMMTVQDLETIVREKIPLPIILVNDNSYKVLYLKQLIQYQGRIYETLLDNPDFKLLAESFRIPYVRVNDAESARRAVEYIARGDRAILVEIRVKPEELPPLNLDATLAMNK